LAVLGPAGWRLHDKNKIRPGSIDSS